MAEALYLTMSIVGTANLDRVSMGSAQETPLPIVSVGSTIWIYLI